MASMPTDDKSAKVSEEKPKAAPAKKKHAVAFDSSFNIPEGTKTVTVSVASASVQVPTDGSPVEVSAKDAKLLVESPAVKKAN